MFHLKICSLLVSLLVIAVSAQPIYDSSTELSESTGANKAMTIDDVENDDHVNIIRAMLLDCMLEEASWIDHRKYLEEGLRSKMAERNFSAFTEEFIKNITLTREAKCAPGANPNDYTPKPGYEFTVIATYQSPESDGQEFSENGAENSQPGNEEINPEDNEENYQ
ncbi:hypothetical protein G9C98_007208 [Cotesia typhae]|uniref:Uncharacterized protein n=2 Tax=Cotesia typhae TaxID=2053667 RepID=A0A8J5RKS1_9HYME|nr:hypothetical protein G9C98_007208 [Cotesia typhae]